MKKLLSIILVAALCIHTSSVCFAKTNFLSPCYGQEAVQLYRQDDGEAISIYNKDTGETIPLYNQYNGEKGMHYGGRGTTIIINNDGRASSSSNSNSSSGSGSYRSVLSYACGLAIALCTMYFGGKFILSKFFLNPISNFLGSWKNVFSSFFSVDSEDNSNVNLNVNSDGNSILSSFVSSLSNLLGRVSRSFTLGFYGIKGKGDGVGNYKGTF